MNMNTTTAEAPRLTPAIRAELERQGCLTPEVQITVFDIKADLSDEMVRTLEKLWADPDWGKLRRASLFILAADGDNLANIDLATCLQTLDGIYRFTQVLEHQTEMLNAAYCRLLMAGQFAEAKEAVKGGVQ